MSSHRTSSIGRRVFMSMTTALGAVTFLAPLFAGQPALAAEAVGEVTKLRGQARAARGGQNVMLSEGAKLQQGDTIVTGPDARMKLQFQDGSTMTLGETSKLTIDKAQFDGGKRDIAASLLDGIVRATVAKADAGSNFQVSSSLVTSAARGTEWIVSIKDHTTSLLVLDGVVNAKGIGETLEDLPNAPISQGVDLGVKQGIAVGEPARSLGLDPKDLGKPMNWKQPKIDSLVSATDF